MGYPEVASWFLPDDSSSAPPPSDPTESVGRPSDAPDVPDWFKIGDGGADTAATNDVTENVGTQESTKKRPAIDYSAPADTTQDFGPFSSMPGGYQPPPDEPAPPPPQQDPTELGTPDTPIMGPQAPAADPTESAGQPESGWGRFKDFVADRAHGVVKNTAPGQAISTIIDDVGQRMNPVDIAKDTLWNAGKGIFNTLDYTTSVGKREMGVVEQGLANVRNDVQSQNYRGLAQDVPGLAGSVAGTLPFVLTNEDQPGYSGTTANAARVIAENPLAALVPTDYGGGPGHAIPQGVPLIGGQKLEDIPVAGGLARTAESLAGIIPGIRSGQGPSIDVQGLQNDLNNGMDIKDALTKYHGNEGLKVLGDIVNPANWVMPDVGVSEIGPALHALGYGRSESALGQVLRSALSDGSLAKSDLRAMPSIIDRFVGTKDSAQVAQDLIDHAARPNVSNWGAIGQALQGNALTPGMNVQDAQVIDRALANMTKLWEKGGSKGTIEDFITNAVNPTAADVTKVMDAMKIPAAEQPYSFSAIRQQLIGGVLKDAATSELNQAIRGQATGNLMSSIGGYLSDGQWTPATHAGQVLNNARQAVTGTVKTGLLAASPRYYLQNLVDNTVHAMLSGAYAPIQGEISKGLLAPLDGLRGAFRSGRIEGNKDFIAQRFGVPLETGQNLANETVQKLDASRKGNMLDILRWPQSIMGNVLERVGAPVEEIPRQALWTRSFGKGIQEGYQNLLNNIGNTWGQHASPEIRQIASNFGDALRSGDASSFDSARQYLANRMVADPTAQAAYEEMRRTLPSLVQGVNSDAATQAYYDVARVFNNYDNHVKFLDTLANGIFLFNKYQTRAPLWTATAALEHPNLFRSVQQANEDIRNYNQQQNPGIRPSLESTLRFGNFGVNPLDFAAWNRTYDAFAHPTSISEDQNLSQNPVARFLRGITQSGVIGQPALPAQIAGERLNYFSPPLENVTQQPFIDALSHIPEATIGGRQVNLGQIAGTVLSPSDWIEQQTNRLLGRQTNPQVMNNLVEYMASRLGEQQGIDQDAVKDALRARTGPLYDQARQMAVDYSQSNRNFNAMMFGRSSEYKPDELRVTQQMNAYIQASDAARALVDQTGKAYNDAIYTRDPYQIMVAQRAYENAIKGMNTGLSSPNANVDSSGYFEGNYFPGRSPGDPNYRVVSKALDDQGQKTKYNVSDLPQGTGYGAVSGDRFVVRTMEGQNPAQDWLRKNGFPDATLVNPVNPYSAGAISLQDVIRSAEQGFNYTDPRTGEVRHIAGDFPVVDALANKPGVTLEEARALLEQSKAYGTLNDVQTGRGLSQADRANLLDAKARQYAAGNVMIQGIDGRNTTVTEDLSKPGGYYDTQQKAFAASGDEKNRLFQLANDILAQTPGGAAYVAAAQAANRQMGATDLWQQEALKAAQANGMLKGLPFDPTKSDAALADDRFMYRVADAPTRKALEDWQNLKADFDARNPNFQTVENGYYAISDAQGRRDYLASHPELQKGWNETDGLKLRIQQDDGVNPDLALLRRDNAILSGQIPSGVARDQNSNTVKQARVLYEQMNDAQRAAYQAYVQLENSPTAQRLFDMTSQAPKKGETGYTEWWRANGNAVDALRAPYNAAIEKIRQQTGVNPLEAANMMRVAKGQDPLVTTVSSGYSGGGGGGGGGSYRSYSSGGSRRSSGYSSDVTAAINAKSDFYKTFDTLTNTEKAMLHNIDSLTSALAKGSRLSADEWAGAAKTVQDALPGIRETIQARTDFYSFYDALSSAQKSALHDLVPNSRDKNVNADSYRSAVSQMRDRLQNNQYGSNTGYGSGGGYSSGGGGARLPTAADVMKYGSFYAANMAVNGGSLPFGFNGPRVAASYSQNDYGPGAQYANTIRQRTATTFQPRTYSTNYRTTTKKKSA